MKALTTPSGNFGPFTSIEVLADRYRCDNTDLPFTVVGTGEIVEADTIQWPEPPAPIVPVPQSVTMRQAARALLDADLLDDVEALVATLPRAYQIDWERASVVERSNPLVEIVRQQKSMTDAQIDDLFITAATL
jgi:hypothetical protein